MDLLAFFNPCLIGSLIIAGLLPRDTLRKANLTFTVFLGTGLGLGITSAMTFLWLAVFGQPDSYYFLFEFGLVLLLLFLALYSHSSSSIEHRTDFIGSSNGEVITIAWLKYLFCVLLIFALGSFALKAFFHDPHGKWDAWAIWNFRARWLFYGGSQWTYAFSEDLIYTHPDYPLLLSASVFRMWVVIGKDIIAVPIAIAGFFTFGSVFLIKQGISAIRGPNQGYLSGILILAATQYLKVGTYQYADIPLAFFILSTIVLLILKEKYPSARLRIMLLAGLTASCAAWTKNEGILFLALTVSVLAVFQMARKEKRKSVEDLVCFFCGLAPILCTEIFFKLKFAPENDIVNLSNLSRITIYLEQIDRYRQIFFNFIEKMFLFNDGIIFLMFVYMLLAKLDKKYFNRQLLSPPVALIGLLLCGYFVSYLISPNSLRWHLNSSLYRLIMHIWPSFVFLFFLVVKGPEKCAGAKKAFNP